MRTKRVSIKPPEQPIRIIEKGRRRKLIFTVKNFPLEGLLGLEFRDLYFGLIQDYEVGLAAEFDYAAVIRKCLKMATSNDQLFMKCYGHVDLIA